MTLKKLLITFVKNLREWVNRMDIYEVITRLNYKADNIKAKLDPSFFRECAEYLHKFAQDLAYVDWSKRPNYGWCEEDDLPEVDPYFSQYMGIRRSITVLVCYSKNGEKEWLYDFDRWDFEGKDWREHYSEAFTVHGWKRIEEFKP